MAQESIHIMVHQHERESPENEYVNDSNNRESRPTNKVLNQLAQCLVDDTEVGKELPTYTFKMLKKENFDQALWMRIHMKNVIHFLYWGSDTLMCKKYVESDESLSAKVIFGEVATAFVGYDKVNNWAKVKDLLSLLQWTQMCDGALLNKSRKCRGYASVSHGNFCGGCWYRQTDAAATSGMEYAEEGAQVIGEDTVHSTVLSVILL